MPQISVWECPKSNKLFKTKDDYLVHLKKTARNELRIKRDVKRMAVKNHFFTELRRDAVTNSDLNKLIIRNWQQFVLNGIDYYWPLVDDHRREKYMKTFVIPELVEFEIYVRGYKKCSNSHNAPFGKDTNFRQTSDKPTSYMGWEGEFTWKINGDFPFFPSDVFKGTGINTGSGSGSSANKSGIMSYTGQVTLFADDWPEMKAIADHRMVLGKLLDSNQTVDDFI